MTDDDEELPNHGVEACYSGGPGPVYYLPVISCTCGFTTGRCDDWEEAGALYDEHLAERKK